MVKKISAVTANIEAKATANVTATVKRGPVSWAYFYTLLGFALTIETGIASMFDPPWALIGLLVVAGVTVFLVLFNGWFQNKLLGWKARYESAER
jgi:hypothetical protein